MLSAQYRLDRSGVWSRKGAPLFNYSDGDSIETRLLSQLRSAQDLSSGSDELQHLITDWPSEYHFSPLRANLLAPFNLNAFDSILEVGSGCGAVTRGLAEQAPSSRIVALEGSLRRAEITRTRCRDQDSVEVCCDSFSEFQFDGVFDLLTLIGVLEYSPSFFSGDAPVLSALRKARQVLSNNGVLVLAIENQLGLKYFNGCSEDHVGLPFFGVNDQYQPGSVRTFGKIELQRLLEQAGFSGVEFLYPFPDYKLPNLLLREEAFHIDSFSVGSLVGQYPSRDYGYSGDKVLKEARTWEVLGRNNLVRDFSNSFLVFAFTGNMTLSDFCEPWLATTFSCRRKKQYLTKSTFLQKERNIVVDKKVIFPQTRSQSKLFSHHVSLAEYIPGISYSSLFLQHLQYDKALDSIVGYLKPWVDLLLRQVEEEGKGGASNLGMVPGRLYDCIPSNIIISSQGELSLIDQEWEYCEPLDVGFVFFRGLYREFATHIEVLEQTDLFDQASILDVWGEIYNFFDIPFSSQSIRKNIEQEAASQCELVSTVSGKEELINYLEVFLATKRVNKREIGEFLRSGGLREHASIANQMHSLSTKLHSLELQFSEVSQRHSEEKALYASLVTSHSWRLTAPMRYIGKKVREWRRALMG